MKRALLLLWGAFFVLLHDPHGRSIYINAEQIDYISPAGKAVDKAGPPEAGARVMVYGVWVWVREAPADIKIAIDDVLGQNKSH